MLAVDPSPSGGAPLPSYMIPVAVPNPPPGYTPPPPGNEPGQGFGIPGAPGTPGYNAPPASAGIPYINPDGTLYDPSGTLYQPMDPNTGASGTFDPQPHIGNTGIVGGNLPGNAPNPGQPFVPPTYPGGGVGGVPGPTPPPSTNPDPNSPIDINPFLNQLFGQRDQALQTLRNAQLAQKKKLLLGFGSRQLAASILGVDPSDAFVQSINEDPNTGFGWMAQHQHQLGLGRDQARQNAALANTFFGSGHEQMQNRLSGDYATALAGETQNLQNQFGDLSTAYAGAQQDWEDKIADFKRQLAATYIGRVSI
jgi:hypothetical protein